MSLIVERTRRIAFHFREIAAGILIFAVHLLRDHIVDGSIGHVGVGFHVIRIDGQGFGNASARGSIILLQFRSVTNLDIPGRRSFSGAFLSVIVVISADLMSLFW